MRHRWKRIEAHRERPDMVLASGDLHPDDRAPLAVAAAIGSALEALMLANPGMELHSLDVRGPRRKPSGAISRRHHLRVTLRSEKPPDAAA